MNKLVLSATATSRKNEKKIQFHLNEQNVWKKLYVVEWMFDDEETSACNFNLIDIQNQVMKLALPFVLMYFCLVRLYVHAFHHVAS